MLRRTSARKPTLPASDRLHEQGPKVLDLCYLRPQFPRLALVTGCSGLVLQLFRNRRGMVEQRGIANPDLQGLIELRAGRLVLSARIKRPGVSVKSRDVPPPGNLGPSQAERFGRLAGVIGVIKNQFAIGVVRL